MRRREFIKVVAGSAATWPLVAHAQQAGKLPTIGFLGDSASGWSPWTAAFVARLRELGWIEDRTIAIKYRWSDGRNERYPEIAAEFVRLKVDVIVAPGSAVATDDIRDPYCFCNRGRPNWRWPRCEPLATRRQRHWTVDAIDRYCRQAARIPAGGCPRASPIGDHV
jgi:hypothetical protein